MEALVPGHVVQRAVHGRQRGAGQRLGHIADAAADEALGRIGIGVAKRLHAPPDLGEEITGLEFKVIVVEESHRSGTV